jgi:predicted HAD superfamily Cof-like phosphohydrolase
MKKQLDLVKEFHEKFLVEQSEEPTLIPENDFLLRKKLMDEENKEYEEACWNGNIIEIADALGDQLYILCGTILKHGLQYKIVEIFDEIQRSNMSKLDENGNPIFREDGKILKGKNYNPPNLEKILMVNETKE